MVTAYRSTAWKDLPLVQPKLVPDGTPEFEKKRADLLRAFYDKVPADLLLPRSIIENPPTTVTGIPTTCGILTPEEVTITEEYDATGLAEAIASRKYTAVAVATAFAKRAIIAHQLTCCLTQWFMDEAIAQAKQLDEHLARTGETVGPLHGVPVSIKEHMPIKGTYSSQGYFATIVKDEKDSQMVETLRNLGAVFYCKTNQPQGIMHLETDSFWGRTLNPHNINLSPGGSTGGESALIAMRGSVLGVGTDIGGSVRGPSTFCGIYGFKPTSYTLPMKDFLASAFPAELNILCSTGPMCHTLRDMELFVSSILATKPHLTDPRLVPIPWTGLKTQIPKPLKVGIINNDGFIEPQPPVRRAISWAKEVLSHPKYAGVLEVKEFKPYNAAEGWDLARKMYWPDGGLGSREAITSTGEPIHPLTEWTLSGAPAAHALSAAEVSALRKERDDFRIRFAQSWQTQDVDIVIGPGFYGPACAHDTGFYWTYTSLYNLVDYPGAIVPTPIKTEPGEKYPSDYKPLSDACKHVSQLWEETNFEGAPIALQVVARKYYDNELFGALSLLQDILNLP
jgi:amidase